MNGKGFYIGIGILSFIMFFISISAEFIHEYYGIGESVSYYMIFFFMVFGVLDFTIAFGGGK